MLIQVSTRNMIEFDLPRRTGLSPEELERRVAEAAEANIVLYVDVPVERSSTVDFGEVKQDHTPIQGVEDIVLNSNVFETFEGTESEPDDRTNPIEGG